jgi:hypothetical protein
MTYAEKREKVTKIQPKGTTMVMDVPVAPKSVYPKCYVEDNEDGGLLVQFYVGPIEAKRLKSRAQQMDMARYIYENILFRAVNDHVY